MRKKKDRMGWKEEDPRRPIHGPTYRRLSRYRAAGGAGLLGAGGESERAAWLPNHFNGLRVFREWHVGYISSMKNWKGKAFI